MTLVTQRQDVWICRDTTCTHYGEAGMAACSDRGHQRPHPFVPVDAVVQCGAVADVLARALTESDPTSSPEGDAEAARQRAHALSVYWSYVEQTKTSHVPTGRPTTSDATS